MIQTLPPLSYKYDALEPYIDARTMEIHHDKHHQAYLDKLNAALEKYPELQKKKVEDLLKDLKKVPEEIRTAVRNHGGGVVNHFFFWDILKKDTEIKGDVAKAIEKKFGSIEGFKEQFGKSALGVFGSGWTWLVLNKGELEIINTGLQDNPISEGKVPILGIDVWEHAYYIKYQNRRADYITAFWNVVNWDKVNELYEKNKK